MSAGAARLVQATLPEDQPNGGDLPIGVVTDVTSGVATVRHMGRDLPMPRLESYSSPVVGHQVVLTRAGGRWIILGRLAGIPT